MGSAGIQFLRTQPGVQTIRFKNTFVLKGPETRTNFSWSYGQCKSSEGECDSSDVDGNARSMSRLCIS